MDFVGLLNSTKNIIEYGFQLKSVSEESRNTKALLDLVQGDLNELKRLATELEDIILPDAAGKTSRSMGLSPSGEE